MSLYIKYQNGGSVLPAMLNDNIANMNLSPDDEQALRSKVNDIQTALKNPQNKVTFDDSGNYTFTGPDAQQFAGGDGTFNTNKLNGKMNMNTTNLNDLAFKLYKDSSYTNPNKPDILFQRGTPTYDSLGNATSDIDSSAWRQAVADKYFGGNTRIL